jgi:hypothetical protein
MKELPLYQCHKKVRAAKVVGIWGNPDRLNLGEHGVVEVDELWFTRNPDLKAGGYFVEYKDGYTSYSPAEPFEAGYAPEEPNIIYTKELTDEQLRDEITYEKMVDVESLALSLHKAGRAAVEAGATVAAEKFGEQTRKFLEWAEITEPAREGRRIQARWLLERYRITKSLPEVAGRPT